MTKINLIPKERIAKVIAHRGVCSRRAAEVLISEGRVCVNGKTLSSPACLVGPEDRISIDGESVIKQEPPRLWCFYKPKGLLTTHKDPEGRPTVFSYLSDRDETLPRLISIGRLDLNSEGLLLLSSSGTFAHYMELPKTGWIRKYRVRVFGTLKDTMLQEIEKGIKIDGITYKADTVTLDSRHHQNSWLTLSLRTGKNREIRHLFEYFGLQVNRLIRVSYGPFVLGDLKVGELREVTPSKLKTYFPKDILSS